MRALLILFLCLWASIAWGDSFGADGFPQSAGAVATGGGGGGGGTSVPYTLPTGEVVHYISPTGDDQANGLTPGAAWKTPNHPMKCGSVIIAAPGAYSGGWQDSEWGTVDPASCPSTTGGIDGAGGVQFAVLLCGGNVGTCTQNGNAFEAFRIATSHWSVQGWLGTQNASAQGGCFNGENDVTKQNYVAFINDIAAGCDLDGFGASGGPCSGCGSFDHIAIVGVVSFNGAQSISGFCGSGISPIPGNADGDTQTHIYVAGYFGAYNTNASGAGECAVGTIPGAPHSDGEGIIFDTYGAGYTTSGFDKGVVLRDAVIWRSGNNCLQVFPQGNGTSNDKAQYNFRNLSCYANNQDPKAGCAGEASLHGVYPTGIGSYLLTNSLIMATQTKCGGTGLVIDAAMTLYGHDNHITALDPAKINVSGNYIWQSAGTTTNVVGPPNTYVVNNAGGAPVFNDPWVYGANTYANPGFTNPTALFSSAPNCTSYLNVTDCMNDVAGLAVYSKIKPTVAPITMGYQPPAACASDPLFPTWLKGIVYLRWTGSAITMNSGLVSKPCNL